MSDRYEIRMQDSASMSARFKVFCGKDYLSTRNSLLDARLYVWWHRRRTTKVAALNRKYAKEGS
jgi:hypothetical protein